MEVLQDLIWDFGGRAAGANAFPSVFPNFCQETVRAQKGVLISPLGRSGLHHGRVFPSHSLCEHGHPLCFPPLPACGTLHKDQGLSAPVEEHLRLVSLPSLALSLGDSMLWVT